MEERPILFSAPMVRALLPGTKTQTRRVCKAAKPHEGLPRYQRLAAVRVAGGGHVRVTSPFGQAGDRLWVRETHLNWWKLIPDNRPARACSGTLLPSRLMAMSWSPLSAGPHPGTGAAAADRAQPQRHTLRNSGSSIHAARGRIGRRWPVNPSRSHQFVSRDKP